MNSFPLVQFLNVIINEQVSSEISNLKLGWQISQQNWIIYRYMMALNYCFKPLPPDEYELQSHKDSQA